MQGLPLPLRMRSAILALLGGLLFAGPVSAQVVNGNLLPNPRLSGVMPMGARAGTNVEVSFTGTDLEDPEALLFSHPGIKAAAIKPEPPKVDPKKVDPKKPAPPPPPITKFSVTVAPDVPVGSYDVRLVNKWGVSNPRVFSVGDLNEVLEKEANNDVEQAQRVEVGTVINGVISAATDVDYYIFAGKKGQRVLIHCQGSSIDSRLQPELKLLNGEGRQFGYSRPPHGEDALVDATLPADGDYAVRLCQFTYTGGNADYFYRLSISTAPYIDVVYPPMIEPGKSAQVAVYGRNLPGGQIDPKAQVDGRPLEKLTVNVTAPNDPQALQRLAFSGTINPVAALLDGFEYRLKSPAGSSNPYLLLFAQAPVVLDNEANDTPETAQTITLPCEIAGRIEKRRDRDYYTFTAKKGDVYIIEVLSHRLGAPTDMYFNLRNVTDPKTVQEIGQGDDTTETLSTQGFYTASRDPQPFRFVVPVDGKYQLLVGSHLGDTIADVQHVYRIRITPERPDFRLFVMPPDHSRPESLHLGQGGNETYTVFASRRDGFKGDIALTVENLPPGVSCKPQTLAGGMKMAALVLTAADNTAAWTGEVKVKGKALIAGKEMVHEARPASITWGVQPQQGIPTISRLDRALMLAVRDKAPYTLTIANDKTTVSHGDKVTVKLKLARQWSGFKGQVQIQPVPNETPQGLTIPAVTIAPDKTDATVVFQVPNNVLPGTYNIVLRSFAPVPFAKDPKAKQANVNTVQSSSPMALTVLPKQVATLSVDNANPTIKLGKQVVVLVRVQRQYDYAGEFKVELVLPPKTEGVSVSPITIPPGQNEAKLTISVPTNAMPGNRPNLVLRAVAMVNGNVPLTHETKLNVNLVK